MWTFCLFARLNYHNVLLSTAKTTELFDSDFSSPCFHIPLEKVTFHFRWGTKTGEGEWLWRHFRTFSFAEEISQSFSYFLINKTLFYHFLAQFLSSQYENGWEITPKFWREILVLIYKFATMAMLGAKFLDTIESVKSDNRVSEALIFSGFFFPIA